MTKWTCEIWWQNSDGGETSTTDTFESQDEAMAYGKARMGTFNARGRMGVYCEVYQDNAISVSELQRIY